MIPFRCDRCGTDLKVQDELAGKRVNCPGCRLPVAVPQLAASVSLQPASAAEAKDLPPKKEPQATDEGTLLPRDRLPGSEGHTAIGDQRGEATRSFAGDKPAPELIDFLAPPEQPGELGRLGGFRILKILGHGGMGVVYQAEDPRLGRKVAVKAMLPHLAGSKSSHERFLREARAAAALEHDHIVPILQVGEDRGAPFIVMPFLPGEPLDERLKRDKLLPVPDVVRIGREVALGLAAAHAKGMIHRDIKPGNIWLEANDERGMMNDERKNAAIPRSSFIIPRSSFRRVKILDFGLARAAGDTGLTQTGAIVGTPQYMAPEQAAGKKDIDHRCDLFSLGCVLYRMSTGKLPFKGDDTLAIISALAMDKPAEPSKLNKDVPRPLSNLIMKLLAKSPQDRLQSAGEVAAALAEIAATFSGEPKATLGKASAQWPVGSGQRQKTKTRWLVGGGVLGVIALGLVVFLLASRERQRPENDGKQAEVQPKDKKLAVADTLSSTLTNSLGMEFVLVPKGKSWLGGGSGKPGDKEVEVLHDFYLGKYEVTQEEWVALMGDNPSAFSAKGQWASRVVDTPTERFPVDQVGWDDANRFVAQLNEREKESGWVYRLPFEMEWEYACRGGPHLDARDCGFDYYFQKPLTMLKPAQANFGGEKGLRRTSKVGTFKPNSLGLFDMHGNVWEWCADLLPDEDRPGNRACRGGSWWANAEQCQAASRAIHPLSSRFTLLGFRVARIPVGKEIIKIIVSDEKKPPATGRVIDLLKLLDIKRDAIEGTWTLGPVIIDDPASAPRRGLISDDKAPACRLKFPYRPPAEYDFRIEFTPRGNNDVLQILSARDRSFAWLMGAWGGKWDSFDVVAGKPLQREGNILTGSKSSIKPGKRHLSVVEVRKDYLAARIDGRNIIQFKTDFSDLDILPAWDIGKDVLGVGTTFNRVVFHVIEVIENASVTPP